MFSSWTKWARPQTVASGGVVGSEEVKREAVFVLSPHSSWKNLAHRQGWGWCDQPSTKGQMKRLGMFTRRNSTCQRRGTGFVGRAFLVLQWHSSLFCPLPQGVLDFSAYSFFGSTLLMGWIEAACHPLLPSICMRPLHSNLKLQA